MAEEIPDWLAAAREEQLDLLRISTYACAVAADRIPFFILDPMLGVDQSDRVRGDEGREEP